MGEVQPVLDRDHRRSYVELAPGAKASVPFSVNASELNKTPALGLMVVTQDNQNGQGEANLVTIDLKK